MRPWVGVCVSFFLLQACGTGVKVVRTPDGERSARAAKPPSCGIPMVRTGLQQGPFVTLARLSYSDCHGVLSANRETVEELLEEKGCALGADGIIVEHEVYKEFGAGTDVSALAVMYTPASAPVAGK
jgi:hypothetical protein